MAKNDNIKDFCTDIADAIRAKKGTNDLINPQDFATEIEGISGGGSGGDTPSSVEYLDLREYQETDYYLTLSILADVVNAYDASGNTYCGINRDAIRNVFGVDSIKITYNAVGIDFSRKVKANAQGQTIDMSIIDLMTMSGTNKEDLDTIPRLTKEQFYDLNA